MLGPHLPSGPEDLQLPSARRPGWLAKVWPAVHFPVKPGVVGAKSVPENSEKWGCLNQTIVTRTPPTFAVLLLLFKATPKRYRASRRRISMHQSKADLPI